MPIREYKFPPAFAWGTSTSAYQTEGGWQSGGRGLSIWDAWSHTPGRVAGGAVADAAADHFGRWRDDVRLLHRMGVPYYRLSLSWARIMPAGVEALRPARRRAGNEHLRRPA